MVQLFKYLAFKKLYDTPQEAAAKAEPEDQDYYGIGARNARCTASFVIGIAFISLCPAISAVAFFNFFLIRLCTGYTVVYAESPKPDLGGEFWVASLQQTQVGLAFYIIGMTFTLMERAEDVGPAIVSGCALIYLIESRMSFNSKYQWKTVPHMETLTIDLEHQEGQQKKRLERENARYSYEQPELAEKALYSDGC